MHAKVKFKYKLFIIMVASSESDVCSWDVILQTKRFEAWSYMSWAIWLARIINLHGYTFENSKNLKALPSLLGLSKLD